MAKNLYNLTAVTTVNDSDLLHVNQGGVSSDKKVTKQNLLKEVNSSISSINNSLTNWVYLEVGSNTYGILKCRYNKSLKLCQMQWSGNGHTPGTTQYSFNLPSSPVLTPNFNSSTPLRNGDLMEVRTDGTVRVGLTGMDWSGGSIMYSIQ